MGSAIASRAQIDRAETEFGAWTRVRRTPDARLAPVMYRDLLGFHQERAAFGSWLEAA